MRFDERYLLLTIFHFLVKPSIPYCRNTTKEQLYYRNFSINFTGMRMKVDFLGLISSMISLKSVILSSF